MFGQEGGCNRTSFLITCVLQNVKSYRFGGAIFANFLLMFQNTVKLGSLAQKKHTKKNKKQTIYTFWWVIIWSK